MALEKIRAALGIESLDPIAGACQAVQETSCWSPAIEYTQDGRGTHWYARLAGDDVETS